jgi:predicted Zn-dependent peptidase
VDEVLALCRAELADVAAHGVTDVEVVRGKGMLKGSLVLGLEDTGSRMTRLAKGDLLYDELLGVDELLAKVDAVTLDDVRHIAAEVLDRPMSLAAIGPFANHQFLDVG